VNTTKWRLVLAAALAGLVLALPAAVRADDPDDDDLDSYIEVAGDPAEAKRIEAVNQIAKYGPKAKKAVPVLLKCLKEKGRLGAAAANALAAVGPAAAKEGVPALREHLPQYTDGDFQGPVATALSKLAANDPKTVKAINGLMGEVLGTSTSLMEGRFALLGELTEALGRCGKAGDPAVKNIYAFADRQMLVTRYSGGRSYIAEADLATMRPYRLKVVKALRAIGTKDAQGRLGRIKVTTRDNEVQKAATKALAELKGGAKKQE
jgi:hypothetical protein